jgi:subtilase family serine protease
MEVCLKNAIAACCVLSLAVGAPLFGQQSNSSSLPPAHLHGGGQVLLPLSSKQAKEDIGIRAHTNYRIFVPAGRSSDGFTVNEVKSNGTADDTTSPVPGYYAETPASLGCLYGLANDIAFCNPIGLSNSNNPGGGSRAIAIVDAFDYPTALSDLKAYSAEFGLPTPTSSNFTVTWAGSKPSPDPNCAAVSGWQCWATEAALDIEMAHAAAPRAHIYLVEATSSNFTDLFAAVTKATALVKAAGGGEVSMSWGGSEWSTESSEDWRFNQSKVVFFGATGDVEGTQYPAVSPNVVAVGGTTVTRSPYTLDFEQENTWEDGGGGVSLYEPLPAFQKKLANELPGRGIPDVAADGNPRTGVWLYDSYENTYGGVLQPWNIAGGTSVATPFWAGIVNHGGSFAASSAAELSLIYGTAGSTAYGRDYRDITYGTCGYYDGWYAQRGWDPCTGYGASVGQAGK